MGTYHIIDGSYVTVVYPGQKKTCGRCHQTAVKCAGNGIAKKCEEKCGPKVQLKDHMKEHWANIGFMPEEFSLSVENYDPHDVTNDVDIKEATKAVVLRSRFGLLLGYYADMLFTKNPEAFQ